MSHNPFASNQFLTENGDLPPSPVEAMVHNWLPTRKQGLNALQLQFEPYTEYPDPYPPGSVWFTSMRQGMGLVVLIGLVAGFLPFLVNWFTAGRIGVVVPLAEIVRGAQSASIENLMAWGSGWQAVQTAAGLQPAVFPGWLAAGLSALGLWINWSLGLLTLWIVYGAGVALVAHWLGSPVTMQRFYALTSYAALPVALIGLGVIPCAGPLISLFAGVYALVVYVFGVRAATGLSSGRAIVATFAPFAMLAALSVVAAISLVSLLAGLVAFRFGL